MKARGVVVTLPTKLSPPRLAQIYVRKRLFTRLQDASARPIVWIGAPAGAGKTTLVASYLEAQGQHVAWYQMDNGDADVASFFHYLGKLIPPGHTPLPQLTPEYAAGLPAFARNAFDQIFAALPSPLVLVFDNYQDVDVASPLHGLLVSVLERVPAHARVIVVSRESPPAVYARLQATQQIAHLAWADLRLTEEEASGAAQVAQHGVSPSQLQKLNKQADGWVAGLILLLEQQNVTAHGQALQVLENPQAVFNFFATEVFGRASDEIRQFLLRTAWLPTVSAAQAEQLTGVKRSRALLDDLNQRHFFTDCIDRESRIYRYHPMFREFLQHAAHNLMTEETLKTIQMRAAHVLLESGESDAAMSLYATARAWATMIVEIPRIAPAVLEQGRHSTVERWIRSIPETIRADSPALLYCLGQTRLLFNPDEARQYFKQAYHLCREPTHQVLAISTWCAIVDTYVFELADFTPLDFWIAEFEKFENLPVLTQDAALGARIAAAMFSALAWRQPAHPAMPYWEEKVWEIVLHAPNPTVRALVGAQLMIYIVWRRGDLNRGEVLVNALRPLIHLHDISPLGSLTLHFVLSGYYWLSGESAQSLETAARGLQLAATSGVHAWDFPLNIQHFSTALSIGDMDAAEQSRAQCEQVVLGHRLMDVSLFYYKMAWLALMKDEVAVAAEKIKIAMQYAERCGNPFWIALTRQGVGQVLLQQGQVAAGRDTLSQARAEGRSVQSHLIEYLTWVAEAQHAIAHNDVPGCLEAARQFLAIGRHYHYQNHLWWQTKRMLPVYLCALEHGVEIDYVRSVIRRRGLLPEAAPLQIEAWPFPLHIYTLGRFSVIRDGDTANPLPLSQGKPLQLLKTLIALGGRDVSLEMLAEYLWPDAEGDAAARAMDTTLHRLRKLLGNKDILQLCDGKLSLDARYCWVDVWAFEDLLDQTERCLQDIDQDAGERIDALCSKLYQLYQGKLLANESDDLWLSPAREKLHAKFLRILSLRARRLEEADQWRKAIVCYQKALEIAPESEALYQNLMASHHRLGERADALDVYQRCCLTFEKQLSLKPSPKTEALYRSIISS